MLKTTEENSVLEAAAPRATTDATSRSLLFISHANPEDNAAASWFATQLSLLGYDVWCEVKNAHAGESGLWLKVQKKIENDAAKFIFILSNASRDFEKKQGVYKEVQAASNTKRDNFIIPLRIEKLKGSVPIIISPDLHVDSENWAHGLKELQERLIKDGVPKARTPDYERIKSWWPAVSAREVLVKPDPCEIDSNVFPFQALPPYIHFLKVTSEGNRLSGLDQIKGVLSATLPFSVNGPHAISFARANDYLELTQGFDIADEHVLPTAEFLEEGHPALNIAADTARNTVTYLIAASLEGQLASKGLSNKALRYSRRKIWFPAHGLIGRNSYRYADAGKRPAPVWFGGTVTSFRKKYAWHFAVQPAVDLRTHFGVLLSPKIIVSKVYDSASGEKPVPLDDNRIGKKLSWWNDEWRKKLLAFMHWLSDGHHVVRIPIGYQEVLLSALPKTETSPMSYLEKDDDDVIREIMSWTDA
ncbi:toll/interleukin-1 receptor domain-containing protein [Bradyrhizobium zhanjiangense]|uniref:toll/interleukin-1 receptor domain-containing protein n=1 Tax=Bradyrhizobium zhanjiangense TaxID=1325107 RepID=UPI00100921A2|nr:toll/interleukin-1 receptor domain-containing protein [Bradyrhizobium zhanjiangense]